jgi:hypothetical protein
MTSKALVTLAGVAALLLLFQFPSMRGPVAAAQQAGQQAAPPAGARGAGAGQPGRGAFGPVDDHIDIVATGMPDIFVFFARHTRTSAP